MKIVILAVLVSLAVLTGCSSVPTDAPLDMPYVRFQDVSRTDEGLIHETGSGIQWNSDYVVTAKHVATGKHNSEYVCDTGCDLQFVRNKATSSIPTWRSAVPREKLTAVGVVVYGNDPKYGPKRRTHVVDGSDAHARSKIEGKGNEFVSLALMKTEDGMSGGPIYANDKKVVGMLLGTTILDINGKVQPAAIYLPYDVVVAQWEKFQNQKLNIAVNAN